MVANMKSNSAAIPVEFRSEFDHTAQYSRDNRADVGHLVSLSAGGQALATDFNFGDPMGGAEAKVPVCGSVDYAFWDKTEGGDLILEGFVNDNNRGILKQALDAKDTNAILVFQFNCISFSDFKDTYYLSFTSDNKDIEGVVSKNQQSFVEDQKYSGYTQISVYRYRLVITGSDKVDQDLIVGYSPDDKRAFKFGQKVGA